MKALIFLLLLQPLSAHSFDPAILTRASIDGNVPHPKVIEMEKPWELSLGKALQEAGFDAELLRTQRKPYAYAITVGYIAERIPDHHLNLSKNLDQVLKTEIRLGGRIQVVDLEAKAARLTELTAKLNEDWETSPSIAFQRLQDTVRLAKSLKQWRTLQDHLTESETSEIKESYLRKLSEKSQLALVDEIHANLEKMVKRMQRETPEEYRSGQTPSQDKLTRAGFVKTSISEEISWLPPRF